MKFLAAIFRGNRRTKICNNVRRILATLSARLLHKFRQNFALGDYWPKEKKRTPPKARVQQEEFNKGRQPLAPACVVAAECP